MLQPPQRTRTLAARVVPCLSRAQLRLGLVPARPRAPDWLLSEDTGSLTT